MRLQNLRDHVKATQVSGAKFSILLGSDHNVHLIMEFDKNRFDFPLTPNEATQIAGMLFGGSQQVSGQEPSMARLGKT